MITDKDMYIAHINSRDETMSMKRVLDKIEIVLNRHTIESTDFLNPYERKLARGILDQFMDIEYEEAGGLESSERQIIVIYPNYYKYNDIDIPLSYLSIEVDTGSLSHRDFLGSILSLGITRDKIGDIEVHNAYGQIIVKAEISSFITMSLERIGNKRVKVKEVELMDLNQGKIDYKEKVATISSLRLDLVISAALNLPRNDSQRVIERDRVKVNWEPIERVFRELEEGDMVSVKGYGRFQLYSIEGISRKGKPRIKLRLLK